MFKSLLQLCAFLLLLGFAFALILGIIFNNPFPSSEGNCNSKQLKLLNDSGKRFAQQWATLTYNASNPKIRFTDLGNACICYNSPSTGKTITTPISIFWNEGFFGDDKWVNGNLSASLLENEGKRRIEWTFKPVEAPITYSTTEQKAERLGKKFGQSAKGVSKGIFDSLFEANQ